MDLILGMIFTFTILLLSVYRGLYVGYALGLGCLIFTYIAYRRGFSLKAISKMLVAGGRKTFVVIQIFILIGAITSIWMASGTVPGIVYYGIKFMNPNYFILYAFLISCLISSLLGTALGTVSTVGIALIAMARGGSVDLNMTAGAIIAGAFFGDRISPMSSSANLVANLTGTDLFTNIKNMFKSSVIPFILSIIFYTYLSSRQPLNILGKSIDSDIMETFRINLIVLLPALLIVVMSLFRVDVKISMLASILVASVLALFLQKYRLLEVLKFLFIGFELNASNPLYAIISGGGIVSMAKAGLVIYLACALSGIFEGTDMLKSVEAIFTRAKSHTSLFAYTSLVSLLTAALGCSQAIAVVLTEQLMADAYSKKGIDKYDLALDLENTAIVLSTFIPWNMAAFVPTTAMNVSRIGFMPYASYLYLVPILSFLALRFDLRKSLA